MPDLEESVVIIRESGDEVVVHGTGIPGPPGTSEDLAVFSRSGVLTVTSGVGRFRFPFVANIVGVSATVGTAATGASLILDLNKNGSTVFTTSANRPLIAAGTFATATEAVPDDTAIAIGDYLTVDIDQIGSSVVGADLTVFVRYLRS